MAWLMRAVAMVALPAASQERWLTSLGLGWQPVDELGLEVGEGRLNISYFIDEGWLPGAVLGPLLALDAHLGSMSGLDNAHLWTVPALRDAPEWARPATAG